MILETHRALPPPPLLVGYQLPREQLGAKPAAFIQSGYNLREDCVVYGRNAVDKGKGWREGERKIRNGEKLEQWEARFSSTS
ncbi:hypothetical protein K0M31_020231 [Melipona bicolor]|uniref:Uncharacterized protein n=1 Tax=Melipona bicolor TaxID=60889 RepID=A0AA40KQJ7_9HYME|nr:hypothetical protein K0M31_020231 [Melipona bicolor]